MRFLHSTISTLAFFAIANCGCERSSDLVQTGESQLTLPVPQAIEESGPQLIVKRNIDAETILADLGLDAWAFEVTGVPWTWEVTISHRPKGINRKSRDVFRRSYLESSELFYAKNSSADLNANAFGSVVLLMPDPVSPEQQFQEDLIITTKLGFDPTGGRGVGRRAARETIRTPMKEIYPASLGSYTSRSSNPRESKRYAEIAPGEAVTIVDEVRDFEHHADPLPPDQRETVRIRLVISALDRE